MHWGFAISFLAMACALPYLGGVHFTEVSPSLSQCLCRELRPLAPLLSFFLGGDHPWSVYRIGRAGWRARVLREVSSVAVGVEPFNSEGRFLRAAADKPPLRVLWPAYVVTVAPARSNPRLP